MPSPRLFEPARARARLRAAVLPMTLAWIGCTGAIDGGKTSGPAGGGASSPSPSTGGAPTGPNSPGGQPPGGGVSPGAPLPEPGSDPLEPDRSQPACKEISPGPAPIRRLTRTEYDNTVRDLLGEDKQLAKGFPGRGAAAQLRQQRRAALGLGRAGRELRHRRQGDRQARGGQAGQLPALRSRQGRRGRPAWTSSWTASASGSGAGRWKPRSGPT